MSKVKSKLLVALTLAFCVCLSVFAFGKITVRADEQAVESTVTMLGGASIRLDENSGIKFTAKISGYNADDVSTSYGMIIMPYDFVGKYITDDTAYHANLNAKGVKYLDRICTPFEYNGEYFINYTMVDIKYSNYTREFIGVAYKKVGGEYTYATTNKANNVRSVAQVALLAKEDTDKFNDYTDEQKAIIEKFITYSSVVGETVISDDFASGSLSGWDSYSTDTVNKYLSVVGAVGNVSIKTAKYTGISEVQFDIRARTSTLDWIGATFNNDSVYGSPVMLRISNGQFSGMADKSENFTSKSVGSIVNSWITLKFVITDANAASLYYAREGEELTKVSDFTTINIDMQNAKIGIGVAASVEYDLDNFVVKHSGGTTTETFDSANSIADTVFSKVNATSVEVYNPASTGKLFLNSGKYFKMTGASVTANSWVRTRETYAEIKSYSYDIRMSGTISDWNGISLASSVYNAPLFIYKDCIKAFNSNSTLYDANGKTATQIAINFSEWTTFKIVPTGVNEDGSESADIFVGAPNTQLVKVGSFTVSKDKVGTVLVSSGQPTFVSNASVNKGEIDLANITVTYVENGEEKTDIESFIESATVTGNEYTWNYVFSHNHNNLSTSEFGVTDFEAVAGNYSFANNTVAKDAVAGGNGMTEDSAIIGVYKVKYIKGSGKFDITFNYGGNGVYGERIAIENGKLTYYTGETAGTVKEFTAEDGAEITLEIRLYKSGAISVKVNDENGVTTLRNSGEFGSFAIFATDGITKVTSVKATQYHIPE